MCKPACVKVVASAITRGTLIKSANVLINRVFPLPVGPKISIFVLSNFTYVKIERQGKTNKFKL